LLQLGFGEAGAKIISGNMKDGAIDATLPGKVRQAIFGFCDIRNFTDCTEVLQGEVVQLVNKVASYVHTSVKHNYGAPNKNIGDAFLLVWKPKGGNSVSEVADSSVKSCLRTIMEIAACPDLDALAQHPDLQNQIPGYQVSMGFGLHYGWAIEGAIGSAEKIDASYLSPHVNIASRLESSTKQYGVKLLISEDLHTLLSPLVQSCCRKIDRVTLKGSNAPMELYTYDFPNPNSIPPEQLRDISARSSTIEDFFTNLCPPKKSREFLSHWSEAMDFYIGAQDGYGADWQAAMRSLHKCREADPEDGPCQTLMDAIKKMAGPDGSTPEKWKGYRKLTEK